MGRARVQAEHLEGGANYLDAISSIGTPRYVLVTLAVGVWALVGSFFLVGSRDGRSVAHAEHAALVREAGPSVYPLATIQVPSRSWVRPVKAPNNMSWPVSSGYVPGYLVGRGSGDGRVTIDGSSHPSDVLLRLYYIGPSMDVAARTVFIAGGERFTLANLSPGTYEVRYRDLDSGVLTRTQRFEVEEHAPETTVTLYKARNRNFETFASAEAEFADVIGSDLNELD